MVLLLLGLAGCSRGTSNGDANKTYRMYILGTQTCPYCLKMKELSKKMFGEENTNFMEINPALTGSEEMLNKFDALASILNPKDPYQVGTPIVVLADGDNRLLALWMGFIEQDQVENVLKMSTPDRPIYWPLDKDYFVDLPSDQAQKVRDTLGLN